MRQKWKAVPQVGIKLIFAGRKNVAKLITVKISYLTERLAVMLVD
jgi:hypothetical protein